MNNFSVRIPAEELLQELRGYLTGVWITDLANTSALLMQHLTNINWVGFYLTSADSLTLQLGPFQGLPACTTIPFGKGVCGQAAETQKVFIVPDVHKFEGHIACDSRSNSEIVIPLIVNNQCIGVLDVDSANFDRFHNEEKLILESIVKILLQKNFK